jgi:outer membrane protein
MRNRIVFSTLALALAAGAGALGAQEAPVPLTLRGAVALAADTAPAVRLAELRTAEAEARVRQSRGGLLPTVGAAAGAVTQTRNRAAFGIDFDFPGVPSSGDKIGPFETYDARLRATAPLLDPAGLARVRATRQLAAGTRSDQDAAAEAAGQRAALAYLRAGRAAATVRARGEDVRLAQELVELARAQLERGVAAGIDLTRAETQLAAARGGLALARNQRAQADVELARALGVDPATRFDVADTLSASVVHPAVEAENAAALALALERRPELKAEQARLEAARLSARAIRAERLPRLEAVADYGVNGAEVDKVIPTYSVGVQVSMPVFDGMRREARTQEQELVAREAGVRAGDLEAQVAAEVRSALLDVASGQEQQAIAAERLQLARAELAQAQERFANGIAGNIEVINAQGSLVRARDAVIEAQFATAAARVGLARATGTTQEIR